MATINDSSFAYPVQQGFTIIEAVVVLCVLVSLMSLGMRFITKDAERTVNQVTAQQLKQITQAAQYYVQDHYQDFKNNPALTLEWQQLVKAGYLSDLQLEKNHYSQTYHFTITQEKDLLQLLLTTQGGNPINEQSLRQIAALAGSSAGYASVLNKGKIVGNQQSWIVDGITLQPGHLASLTLVSGQEVMDAATFLRRTKIADHPEYNTMKADLEIDKHLLKLVNSNSKTTLSSTKIELRNYINSNKTKIITLDVEGTPMLNLRDTYNTKLGGISTLLSGSRLEFIRDSDGNNIKLDNRNPSMSIENSNHSMQLKPNLLSIGDPVNNMTLGTGTLDIRNSDHNVHLRPDGLFFDGKKAAPLPPEEKMYSVGDIDNAWDLQRLADQLDCNHNEGRLFLVGDGGSSLRKKLLVCIWRYSTSEHNFLVVADGFPPRFGSVDVKKPFG